MQVNDIDIDKIKPYPRNAKTHPDEQVEQIAKSIEKFGWAQPLVIDGDGVVVIGHGRLMAAEKLGLTSVPCVEIDGLTDEEIRMLRLADNKLNESPWDFDMLAEELEDLDFGDLDIDFGLDDDPGEVTEDDFDAEPPEEPKSKRGEIYQLGRHRLMCGDSTDAEDVKRLMGGAKAEISFTSPPYNVGVNGRLSTSVDGESKYIHDDNSTAYLHLLERSTENSLNHARWCFINIQMLANNKADFITWLNSMQEYICDVAIWHKLVATPAMAERVMNSNFEFVWILSKENPNRAIGTKTFRGDVANVFQSNPMRGNEYSGMLNAVYPVCFPSHFIQTFTNTGESVLDLFGGSGTTLIACEQLNRTCYMMELEPKYIDIIINRWEQFTGEKAKRIEEWSNGESGTTED